MTAFVTAIDQFAASQPDAIALSLGARRQSYRQLAEASNRVAAALLEAGLPRGTRIGLLDHNSIEFIEALVGICKAACVPVGINSRLAGPELQYIVRDARMPFLLVGPDHVALLESIAPALEGVKFISLGGAHSSWPAYTDWRDSSDPQALLCLPSSDDDLLQLYTSGTTGQPKGACHTLGAWSHWGDMCRSAGWGCYDSDTVMLACMPLFHIAALGTSLIALESGGRVVLMRRFEPQACLELIEREQATDTIMAPAVIAALLAAPAIEQASLGSLRQLCYGAAPISEALLAQVRAKFSCRLTQLYGMTENLGLSCFLAHEDHAPALGKLRSCGRSYAGSEMRIVGEDGESLPPGETGEVVVRSPILMRGYFRNATATCEALRDGWLHTGDAGYLDEDGYLFIRDRLKDMIISGGENVYPAEVENALAAHSGVAEVAVIGIPDEHWGEKVMAVVVARTGHEVTLESLRSEARKHIAGFKLPTAIEFVDALPRNASGKVLRRQLRDLHWQGHDRQVS